MHARNDVTYFRLLVVESSVLKVIATSSEVFVVVFRYAKFHYLTVAWI